MKTEMALLLANDGIPILSLEKLCEIRCIKYRTALNQISDGTHPVPVWKDGGTWFAAVSDVAQWIDRQRSSATELLQRAAAH